MVITFVICALSIALCLGYTLIAGRSIKKRIATSLCAGQTSDEDKEAMSEYRDNVQKLIFMSIGVVAATIATVVMM